MLLNKTSVKKYTQNKRQQQTYIYGTKFSEILCGIFFFKKSWKKCLYETE